MPERLPFYAERRPPWIMNKIKYKDIPLVHQFQMQKRGFKIFYVIMWGIVLFALAMNLIRGHYENAFTCTLTLVLFMAPLMIEHIINIDLPDTLMTIIVLFIFAADVLGEMNAWYIKIPWWDTMLHTLNGFLAAAVGFSLIDILNKSDNIAFNMSPFFVVMTAFCFSMTIGVLWEFFEYGMDTFFLTDMQKDTIITQFGTVLLDQTRTNIAIPVRDITEVIINETPLGLGGYLDVGLHDTMKDLLVNFVGAVVFSFVGYFYIKYPKKFAWVNDLIPKRVPQQQYSVTQRK